MAKVGELLVDVLARTTGLQKGLKKGETQMQRFKQVAGNVAAGIAAAFSINALRNMINDFAELGDSFDKMSQRTGVSVEALSGLKFAAEQSGASIETVEMGIRNMQRVLLDVQQGSSTAATTLQMLGLNIQQLQTLSPEQQFLQMAQAISKVQDPSRQAALAMELFGRSGTQLLPMLQQGEAGIEALIAEARRLGIVMSEEDAKAAADFTDAMNRLSSVFKGIATQVASVITPILTKLSNLFTSLDATTRGIVVQIGLFGTAFLAAIYIIPKVISVFRMLIGAYKALATAQAVQMALSGPKGWAILAGSAVAAGLAIAGVALAMHDVNKEMAELESASAKAAVNANRPPTNVNVVNNDEIDNADARAKYLNNQRRIEDEIKGLRGDAKSQAILKVARLL